ncbi:MAG: PulJ/GspJ family protein [Terrimicrobiaceae bacterium]
MTPDKSTSPNKYRGMGILPMRGNPARHGQDAHATTEFLNGKSAFTLLEMLVATAVFSLMIVMLLQLTSGLMSNANRTDENLKIDQDVRILFDLMRRDLAQARIGTNQNQFLGTPTRVSFVSSSSRLKTNYVSDQRLVTYYLENNTIYRSVVEPTMSNYPGVWDPLNPAWWIKSGTNNAEALLEGVYPYDSNYTNPFTYSLRTQTNLVTATDTTNPPSGLTIGFSVAGKRAIARAGGGTVVNTNEFKKMKYDIELNIPPPFNP